MVSPLPLIPSFPSRFIPSPPSFSKVPWLVPISLMSNQGSLVNSFLAGFSHIYTSIPKTLSRHAAPQIPTHFHTCPQIIISLLPEFSDKVSTTNIFQNQAELLGHIEKGRLTTSTFVIAIEPVCSVQARWVSPNLKQSKPIHQLRQWVSSCLPASCFQLLRITTHLRGPLRVGREHSQTPNSSFFKHF